MNTMAAYEARMADPSDAEAAYSFCEDLARRHYENFPVASRLLSAPRRKAIAALYAFARIADDFADEPEHGGSRRERLLEWRDRLRSLEDGDPDHPAFAALKHAMKRFDLPREPFDDLLDAFIQDVDKHSYEDFPSLLDYCRRSANPVGRVVLMVHGIRGREAFELSDSICTALQLANFWQDISVDLLKGRIYIPREDFRRFGVDHADLGKPRATEPLRRLLAFEVQRTREIFEKGKPLPAFLKFPLSWEIRLTWEGGMGILRKIEEQGFDTLRARPSLGKGDWLGLLWRSLF